MKRAPLVRVDVVTITFAAASAILVIGTGSVLAKRYHAHPLAKAWHTLF